MKQLCILHICIYGNTYTYILKTGIDFEFFESVKNIKSSGKNCNTSTRRMRGIVYII